MLTRFNKTLYACQKNQIQKNSLRYWNRPRGTVMKHFPRKTLVRPVENMIPKLK